MKNINIKQGIIFLVAAPSGAGKSSLVKKILEYDASIDLSTSYTTRPIRIGEQNGREYHFISPDEFKLRQEKNEFVEYAIVHGNFYGTSKKWLEQELQQNKKILLEIDWQGANQVKALFDKSAYVVYIFILPPSVEELKRRLLARGQDNQEIINNRLNEAYNEMHHAIDADYIIINEDFNKALNELLLIIKQVNLYSHIQYKNHLSLINSLLNL